MTRLTATALTFLLALPATAQEKPSGPYQQGLAHHANGRYQQAVNSYSRAIQINPRAATAYLNRGVCHHEQGDLRRAVADYSRAVRLDPANGLSFCNRGAAWQGMGQSARALMDYTRGITLTRKAARIHLHRGTAHQTTGDLESARRDYRLALAGDEKLAEAYYNLGTINHQQGKLKAAAADYRAAVKYASPNKKVKPVKAEKPSAKVTLLIKQLSSSSWKTRNAATKALIKIGKPAVRPLQAVLESKDAEVRTRAKQCLDAILRAGKKPAYVTRNASATLKLAKNALALVNSNGQSPPPIAPRPTPADLELMRKFLGQ